MYLSYGLGSALGPRSSSHTANWLYAEEVSRFLVQNLLPIRVKSVLATVATSRKQITMTHNSMMHRQMLRQLLSLP